MNLNIEEKKDNNIIIDNPNENRSDFYLDGVKSKISNPLLDEFTKKYKPEELTIDGIPSIETQIKEIEEKDNEQLEKYKNNEKIYNREMVQRVKCLSLYKMGINIMTNTNSLNTKNKQKLQDIMWSYNDIEHIDIIKEFNDLISSEIFDNSTTDISKLPIYDYF